MPGSVAPSQVFEAWVHDQSRSRTDTEAHPASVDILRAARSTLWAWSGRLRGKGSEWEHARRRLLRMPLIPYGGNWESRWGPGVWTDGVRIWVAESTLVRLLWDSLRPSRNHTPCGMVPRIPSDWHHGSRGWSALVQALVQAAGQSLDTPVSHWWIKHGRRRHAITCRPEVVLGVRPWSSARADLLRVPGGAVAISRHGWGGFTQADLLALESDDHPQVIAWKRRWMAYLVTGQPAHPVDKPQSAYASHRVIQEAWTEEWLRAHMVQRLEKNDPAGAWVALFATFHWLAWDHAPWFWWPALLAQSSRSGEWSLEQWGRAMEEGSQRHAKSLGSPAPPTVAPLADPRLLHALHDAHSPHGELAMYVLGHHVRSLAPLPTQQLWQTAVGLGVLTGHPCPAGWQEEVAHHPQGPGGRTGILSVAVFDRLLTVVPGVEMEGAIV